VSQDLADGARLEDEGEDPHRATALARGAEAAALTGLVTYPDLSAVCEREKRDVGYPHALTNPVVLVAHREPAIEVWSRFDAGWSVETARAGGTAVLPSIGCRLDVDEIFGDPLAG
jgi:hypothetical protein